MAERLGTQITVENRDGANGAIGMDYASRQPADGSTLVMFYALQHPETRASLEKSGMEPDPAPGEAFDRRIREEMIRWAVVIKAAGLKVT